MPSSSHGVGHRGRNCRVSTSTWTLATYLRLPGLAETIAGSKTDPPRGPPGESQVVDMLVEVVLL